MPAPTNCPTRRIIGNGGPTRWSMRRDRNGHKTYVLKHRVQVAVSDGPAIALDTPGLPVPGSAWNIDNDYDQWAFCTREATVDPVADEGEPNEYFDIEQVFSTEPMVLCADDTGGFEDPLLHADIVRGNFVRYSEEAVADRFNRPIINSAFEQFRGPQVEFDKNRPQVKITQNVADLELELLCGLIDGVNLYTMWGFGPRCVKFSACEWQKHYYTDCSVYYTRTLEFDIRAETFDRVLLDEGTKVLSGEWNAATGTWRLVPVGVATLSMNRTNGSADMTVSTGDIAKIVAGQTAVGTGIPDGTTVLSVSSPTVTLSANATSTGTGNVTFKVEPDYSNPNHYIRFKDPHAENTRVILNGYGQPATRVLSGLISGIEEGATILINTPIAHGLTTGDIVVISGVTGTVEANGQWTVEVINATQFNIPTSSVLPYTGGGGWVTGPGTGPGAIRVEKYPSLDLSQLRVPGSL